MWNEIDVHFYNLHQLFFPIFRFLSFPNRFLSISIYAWNEPARIEELWRGWLKIFPPFLRRSLFSRPDYRRDQATRIRDVDTLSDENCQMFTPAAVAQLQRWTGHVRLAISVYRAARGNREDLALIVKGQKGTVALSDSVRDPQTKQRFVYSLISPFRFVNELEFRGQALTSRCRSCSCNAKNWRDLSIVFSSVQEIIASRMGFNEPEFLSSKFSPSPTFCVSYESRRLSRGVELPPRDEMR